MQDALDSLCLANIGRRVQFHAPRFVEIRPSSRVELAIALPDPEEAILRSRREPSYKVRQHSGLVFVESSEGWVIVPRR